MSTEVAFEITPGNCQFAGAAATLRELSLLFPMMLARKQDGAAQLFIALHQLLQDALSECSAADSKHPTLARFLGARARCLREVADDMLRAKREGQLHDLLRGYHAYLAKRLLDAHAPCAERDMPVPSDGMPWLLAFDGQGPTRDDLNAAYTLGRAGPRLFLIRDT
ncbi:hypothetical protein H8Z72_22590 (plasmid) [Xanthomonas citri pv. citri]|uniref:hypothetical protein n=1 Tax=Xanthomonas citri TaxID=346 RepID=UPI0019340E4D|nr:hypothetical protein [Xanthomonas citri]QRD62681.1 hypothetical protein H8Z74_23595 [Xanthomonas citri pv. citri]QRD67216.1 hypothetical protein H8Z73_22575 [Xanthomonas citri pv. citri]QRD71739.1 hypothetical protein H8Z72_22590 [Xanthomonas citri pv. citri]